MKKLLSAAVLAGILSTTAPAGATSLPRVPLTAATTTQQLATVVSDFGNLVKPHERFADVLSGEGKRWAVITPPGMATNGGISVSTSGAVRQAALLPSQLLRFTPLATSATNNVWVPGVVDAAVARHPDAVAASAGETLVVDLRGRVHASTDRERWSLVKVTLPKWAKRAQCKPVAVAFASTTTTQTFGLSCAKATRSVVATSANSGATGSVLLRQLLRLQATTTGFVAVEWVPSLRRVVIEQFSTSLQLVSTTAVAVRQVRATAVNEKGAVLLLGTASKRAVVASVNRGVSAVFLAPKRARAVAFNLSGQAQVLSVIDHVKRQEASLVTVRNLVAGKWTVTERFGVTVPYGSSQ